MKLPALGKSDSSAVDFWETYYRSETLPWEQGQVTAPLKEFLQSPRTVPGTGRCRTLIPGCGSGHDALAFCEAGFRVTALDYSRRAVARARRVLGTHRRCVVHGDFFRDEMEPFDLVYERAFLCALPPDRRESYAKRMAEIVQPGGRLVGVFYFSDEVGERPPHGVDEKSLQELLAGSFELVERRKVPARQSVDLFRVPRNGGRCEERWLEWRRKVT